MFGFSRLPKLRRWSGWALSHRGTASAAASKSWMVPAAGVAALGVVGAAYAMSGEKSKVGGFERRISMARVYIYRSFAAHFLVPIFQKTEGVENDSQFFFEEVL